MYGNPSTPVGVAGTLAATGGGDFTLALVIAAFTVMVGALLMLRNRRLARAHARAK